MEASEGMGGGGQSFAGRIQEGAGQVAESLGAGAANGREAAAARYRRAERAISRNPAPSLLIAFGVGFGIGITMTLLLTRSEESTWSDWHLADALRRVSDQLRHVPERIARTMPEMIARHIG
jgi:hypothetical protein